MKLALVSDIHLEFGPINFQNTENADVLILSGDILISQELHDFPKDTTVVNNISDRYNKVKIYRDFLQFCSDNFKHVIYVAGNHEFYHGKFPIGIRYLREEAKNYSNVYFMENDTMKIDDVLFIGCTLWTDMNRNDPITVYQVSEYMNDYRIIRNSDKNYRKLSSRDTLERNTESFKFISDTVKNNPNEKIVVVTHMSPSRQSTHPRYKDDYHTNGGYSSQYDEFIMDNPQIKVWTHGHTHDSYDYTIGTTRILCNPRGYLNYEVFSPDFELKYFEV